MITKNYGKTEKNETKTKLRGLVRTADKKNMSSKSDTTNWSYKFIKVHKTLTLQNQVMR